MNINTQRLGLTYAPLLITVYIVQDLSADLRPLDAGEWSAFDGWIMECAYCYFRCMSRSQSLRYCPSCGKGGFSCVTEADKIIWCEG